MPVKTFLLGAGCQKGGTTWLYRYLNANPCVDLGFKKEYHVFDALYVDECRVFLDRAVSKFNDLSATTEGQPLPDHIRKPVDFYRDTDTYFDYFAQLFDKSPLTRVVGDLTPSYSALPGSAFLAIRNGLCARGFSIKVIFIMRDPVQRIWSQVRMGRARKLKSDPAHKFERTEEEAVLAMHREPGFEIRTRYEKTIQALESAFDARDIYYGFFENLFEEDAIRKITDFLEIPFIRPRLSSKINATQRKAALGENTLATVSRYYKDTHGYVMEKFGEDAVRALWEGSRFIDK